MQKVEEIFKRSKDKTAKVNKELLQKRVEDLLERLLFAIKKLALFLSDYLRDLTARETAGSVSTRIPRPPSVLPSTSVTL